ncbi:hypothetical protein ONE63_011036 [Megalurothrips usitatus]|uniref:Uncharacterized protein n=1 Tax=Megalurothrips usitatus TaxID=439358 RepID=A0AAV7XEV1_9NEOP|nr:hypothetical protein ONE63_011036 [Megalurothrips usitatus]
MKTCVLLLAMAAACAAMPHPGPPAPPGPPTPTMGLHGGPGGPTHGGPMPAHLHDMVPPQEKGAKDLKTDETLYLASPYSAYPAYSAYSAYSIPRLGLGYSPYGLQYGLGAYPAAYPSYYY